MHGTMVVGFTGTLASGKTTAITFLSALARAQGIEVFSYSLSDEVRSEVRRLGIPVTRGVLKQTADSFRAAHGSGIWGAIVASRIESDLSRESEPRILVLVDGIRNPAEVDELRLRFGDRFRLLAVEAPRSVVYANLQQRKRADEVEQILNDRQELDRFIEVELGAGEPEYGHNVLACIGMADYPPICNDGSIRDLELKIAEIARCEIFSLYDEL